MVLAHGSLTVYRSNGIFFRGWQYASNFARTGPIFDLSSSAVQPVNVEYTSPASSPITVNNVATWIASDFKLSSVANE